MRSLSLGAVQPLRVPLNPINEEESPDRADQAVANDWKTKFREERGNGLPLILINDSPLRSPELLSNADEEEEDEEMDIETEWKQFKERMARQNSSRRNDVEQVKESFEPVADEFTEWEKFKRSLTVNKDLIPLKLSMLLYYGGCTLYLPYLTLHMVQIGLNIEEIAIIYSVLPFATSIVPPVAGYLADKYRTYKLFLVLLILSSAFFHTMLFVVDARIETKTNSSMIESVVNETVPADLVCNQSGASLRFDNLTCTFRNEGPEIERWSALWLPSDCYPLGSCSSSDHQSIRMQLCSSLGNCSQLDTESSMSQLEMELWLKSSSDDVNPGGDSCTVGIFDIRTNIQLQTDPVSLLCNCLIECPVSIKLSSDTEDEASLVTDTSAQDMSESDRLKHQKGFWIYFLLRIAASSSTAASFSMLDATAICMVKKYKGDLGKQRLFGVVGQAVFSMLAGIVLDWTKERSGEADYSVLFYMADGLFVVVILLITRLDVDIERVEASSLAAGLRRLIRLIDVDVFMLMMLLLGTCWGFLESFLFIFLMELNANSYLLGMTVALGCVIGVPFLYISDAIVRKVGSVNVFVLAFALYSVRFYGYSLIRDPWLCLPFEALEAVTVHMMAVASSMYCAAAAPTGLLATLNGAVGSVHYSFGRGVGSFSGGILIATFGTRTTFQIFGTAAAICGATYFVLYRFYLMKMEKVRLRRKSEHIAEVRASGGQVEEETQQFMIPPDNLMGRRMSCF